MKLEALGKYIIVKIKLPDIAAIEVITKGGIALPSQVTNQENFKIPEQLDPRNIAEVVSVGPDVKGLVPQEKVYVAGGCPLIMEKDGWRWHFCYIENIVGIVHE